MTIEELQTAVSALSREELAAFQTWFDGFASDTWDRLFPHEDCIRLLQERLEHHRKYPDDTIPWEDVKARILASRRGR